MDQDSLRTLQLAELKILIDFDNYCRAKELEYSLYAGTALGAVRHNSFIPWDDDIDYLVVALSTDEFNESKGKKSFYPYEVRREMLESIRYVDLVIPEHSWEQKLDDVRTYGIDVVVMGGDWAGSDRFEYLREHCELVYLDRTPGISTTQVKSRLNKGGTVSGAH